MIKVHVIQARYGDCLLLEYGEADHPSFMLIDGGPARNYKERLKPALASLLNGQTVIGDIVISHVDNDHILGVLDMLTEWLIEKDTGGAASLMASHCWFNSFSNTIRTRLLETRLSAINKVASLQGVQMLAMNFTLTGIREGARVIQRAGQLGIPVNEDTGGGPLIAAAANPPVHRGNMEIIIAGPTTDNLQKLQTEWEEWVRKNEKKIAAGEYTPQAAADLDKSIPNLSSIVLLVKAEGKTILLTGDCRSDHLQQGLIETGCSADGRLHTDVFKVQHHGSCRNVKGGQEFFEQVTADTYIISADGTYHNPDYDTLRWIVEAAHKAGRKIKLVLTNATASSEKLLQEYDPAVYGYEPVIMKQEENYLTLGW
ncbi:MAG: hypothetical protein U0U70_08425 [Chitinophagaceae bacterium]